MSKKTLKFHNVKLNKKEFHAPKQPITLDLVNVNQILISDKFKIVIQVLNISSYNDDNVLRPLYLFYLK